MLTGERALEVVEYTDPACPWSWGCEPTVRRLRARLDPDVRWRRVFGQLFEDEDDPAPSPEAEVRWFQRYIETTAAHTGSPYAEHLRWLPVSSRPACLVAKAAEEQGLDVADRVLRRLREATFLLGTPVDTLGRAREAVSGVPGLDLERMCRRAVSADVAAGIDQDWQETRNPVQQVRDLRDDGGPHPGRAKCVNDRYRYAFPTLSFHGPGGSFVVPGWRALDEYESAARSACPEVALNDPIDAAQVLDRYRSLSAREWFELAGAEEPPGRAVRVDMPNGPLWLHPDEAAVHPLLRPDGGAAFVSKNETPFGVY